MALLRDRNGKTEEEFLRDYDVTQYFRPSVTVDAVLYTLVPGGLRVLLIRRGGHPFLGRYAFPGGFVESDEPCEAAAARELFEETGIDGVPLRQLVTASAPGRDPRWRNITVVFCACVSADVLERAAAGDDAAEAVTALASFDGSVLSLSGGVDTRAVLNVARDPFGKIDLNNTVIADRGALAFDHATILAYLCEQVAP